jgi:predicted GNAT superfamily acetyltransferase
MPEYRTIDTPQRTAEPVSPDSVTIRHLTGWGEYQAVLTLQQEVWGVDFADLVPASILKVSQRLGGVTAGAFAPDGRMLGFVFGMTGIERGKLVHWSDMLGVRAEARDLGIGRRLKMFQRDTLLPLGVSIVYWTYDPLVARNAYLNLEQLGTEVTEYVADFYGARTSSTLHEGLGTDRFIVAWHIDADPDRPPRRPLPPLDSPNIPILDSPAVAEQQLLPRRPPRVRVPIPLHIDQIQRTSLAQAAQWRANSRPVFQRALALGYRITGFQRDDARNRGLYELEILSSS